MNKDTNLVSQIVAAVVQVVTGNLFQGSQTLLHVLCLLANHLGSLKFFCYSHTWSFCFRKSGSVPVYKPARDYGG